MCTLPDFKVFDLHQSFEMAISQEWLMKKLVFFTKHLSIVIL